MRYGASRKRFGARCQSEHSVHLCVHSVKLCVRLIALPGFTHCKRALRSYRAATPKARMNIPNSDGLTKQIIGLAMPPYTPTSVPDCSKAPTSDVCAMSSTGTHWPTGGRSIYRWTMMGFISTAATGQT